MTMLDAAARGPTSEPTEFKDRLGTFMLEKGPTSEPTEFRANTEDFLTPAVASEPGIGEQMVGDGPTEEPTIFDINIGTRINKHLHNSWAASGTCYA